MSVLAVIPARWQSSRFPGKPLADIHGKPMIQWVWERVCGVAGVDRVIIATDDARILDAARAFGAEAQMTGATHPSGTDRVWEVAHGLPTYDWILNVQGDEPQIHPATIQAALAGRDRWPQADIITLVSPMPTMDTSPHCVKAVLAASGRALYFSRAPIPWQRDESPSSASLPPYRHVGLYLYRREALACLTQWPPSALERIEQLEQLRALENGLSIYAAVVACPAVGIDTPADLAALRAQGPDAMAPPSHAPLQTH